jgi:hypothetical protein
VVGDVISVLGMVKVLATGDGKPAGAQAGKGKGQAKQNLFLIYLDALSVVNNKRASKGPGAEQQQPQQSQADQQQQAALEQQLLLQRGLSSAAPNMPDFTLKDLQFILTFTGTYTAMCDVCKCICNA